MKEKWIRINTIEGLENVKDYYWISNADENKIINRNTGKQLKIWINKGGYPMITLGTKDGKQKKYRIHILKAKAFLFGPIPLGANVVRHLNDIKTDNRLINLAWGTTSDNVRDCIVNDNYSYEGASKGGTIRAKQTSKPVKCLETGIIYPSTREAERCTGIFNASISHCCNGERQTASGLHWEFVNKEVNSNDMECK